MIVQIRAGMGAGKSTLVRRLLVEHNGEKIHQVETGCKRSDGVKPRMMDVWRCDGDLYVLGSYRLDSTSGNGGDPLYGQRSVEVMRHYAQYGHVLHEGARAANQRPNGWMPEVLCLPELVWTLLDTPLETCIDRIYQRRVERQRNVGKPLNEASQAQNYRAIQRIAAEGAQAGIKVVTLNDAHAYDQLRDMLRYGGWAPRRWDWSGDLGKTA